MRTPWTFRLLLFVAILTVAPVVYGQSEPTREKTRERLGALLARVGPDVKIEFQQSTKNPFNFVGVLKEGLTNSDTLEVLVMISAKQTISIQAYPHYKGSYINIDKARNSQQLLRKLVQLNDSSFLFWGADDTGDVFTGYTITLESGFPDEAIRIVLASVRNSDKYVGEMRPSIDGTTAP